jgi:uncharacterized membrane protein
MFGWEHGFPSFWWIFTIFIFVMIIACMFMMRGCSCMFGRRNLRRFSGDSAEEILKKRYSIGEIDQKEYEEMKAGIIRTDQRSDG